MEQNSPVKAPTKPTFKGGNGVYLTKQLFYETAEGEKENVLYTLKDEDHLGYPSIRRLYVETGDLSEYHFATTYFASWRHYQRLLAADWFRSVIEEAREELSVKLAAENLANISAKARAGDLKANQYLLERKWIDKKDSVNPVGRPSKEAIKKEAEKIVGSALEVEEDLSRLREAGMLQ